MVRFGLAMPHYDTSLAGEPVSWKRLVEVATAAEAAGFDSIWVSDHLFLDWGKYGGPTTRQGSLECWTTLTGLAGVTRSVRLGSLALCNDFRNPALLAKMIATLDLLSEGRVDVGLGAGWYEAEYSAGGIAFEPAGIRIRRMGESAHVIARLLEGEEVTFSGSGCTLDGAICRPGPAQVPRPPIWMGGKGDYLLKTAARHADGWNFSWLGSVATYAQRLEAADRICSEVERERPLRKSVGAYVMTGTDDADVKRRYGRLLEVTPPGVLTETDGGGAVSWEEFKASRIAGGVSEVVDTLGQLSEMGAEEVIVTLGALPFQLSDIEDVELLGAEVLPALR